MSRVPTVRKADLDRVLAALKGAGLGVAGVVVRPGGEIVITPGPALAAGAAPLTATAADGEPASLEAWRRTKRGGRAT